MPTTNPSHRPASVPGPPRRRRSLYLAALAVIVIVVAVVAARLTVARLAADRGMIERVLSHKIGHPVHIASTRAFWNGIHPGLDLTGARIDGAHGTPDLTIERLRASLAWLPLLAGHVEPYSLEIVRPTVQLTLGRSGTLKAAGLPVPVPGKNPGRHPQWLLLMQHAVSIRDGTLIWQDLRHNERLEIRHLELAARGSFGHHTLRVSADLPPSVCARCSLFLDLTRMPSTLDAASGKFSWHLDHLRLDHLPWVLHRYLPQGVGGSLSSTASSRWRHGRPVALAGTLEASDLRMPGTSLTSSIHIHTLAGVVRWQRQSHGWVLSIKQGRMGTGGPMWRFGTLYASVNPVRSTLRVDQLNLDQISWLLAHARLPGKLFASLRKIDADGSLDHVRLNLSGPLSAVTAYSLRAQAQDLSAAAYGPFPGFNGVTGAIHIRKDGGEFSVESMKGLIFWPRYFKSTLGVRSLQGRLAWARLGSGWRVDIKDLRLDSDVGRVSSNMLLQLPAPGTPQIDLSAEFQGLDLARLRGFYTAIPQKGLRDWLQSSILGGDVTQGSVHLKGDLSRFPFSHGGGRFDASGTVQDGTFEYLSSWDPLKHLKASLGFSQGSMTVSASGTLAGLPATGIRVHVDDFAAPQQAVVHVQGSLEGPAGATLGVLRRSGSAALIPRGVSVQGQGRLNLDLRIPIADPAAVAIRGDYRADGLSLTTASAVALSNLKGDIGFDEHGPTAGAVSGRLLGGPVAVRIVRHALESTVFAQGKTTSKALARLDPRIGRYLSGEIPWKLALHLMPGTFPVVQLQADLKNAAVSLPRPLNKPEGQAATLEVGTVRSDAHFSTIGAHLADLAAAQLVVAHRAHGWALLKGRVTVGGQTAPLSPGRGIVASVFADRLNADRWLKVIKDIGAGSGGPGLPITRVALDVRHFVFGRRDFGLLRARLSHHQKVWSGRLSGDDVAGNVAYEGGRTPVRLALTLDRLVIPKAAPPLMPVTQSAVPEPTSLPEIALQSRFLQVGDRVLGAVDFLGVPEPQGWRIAKANFRTAATALDVRGQWLGGPQQRVQLHLDLASRNLGQTLAEFGAPNQVAGGKASLNGVLGWAGSPGDFGLPVLDGKLTFSAANGRFKQLHQGASRLLGILDIRSLARYLTLDFSTVFKRGYIFDKISGSMQIHKGDASTQGITVQGPSADLHIRGNTDLVREQFNMAVTVDPHIPGLTLAGASLLASPVAGAAVLLMQRVFRKQISEGTRIIYLVKGPWAHPSVHEKPD